MAANCENDEIENYKVFREQKFFLRFRQKNEPWSNIKYVFHLSKDGNILFGNFLTTNWFQVRICKDMEYFFEIVSRDLNTEQIKKWCSFILDKDRLVAAADKLKTNPENLDRIHLENGVHSLSITLRDFREEDDWKHLLISLPEFTIQL
jgi:hypothetical protein